LKSDDGGAGGQELADIDRADSEPARKGRVEGLLRQQRLLLRHLGCALFRLAVSVSSVD